MNLLEKIQNAEKRLENAENTLRYKEKCLKSSKSKEESELFTDHVNHWSKIVDRRRNTLNMLKKSL